MKTFTVAEVAATIDHAALKPNFTDSDIRKHAHIAAEHNKGCEDPGAGQQT